MEISKRRGDYRAAYEGSSDPNAQAAALWGLGRAQYTDGRNTDALATLQQLNSNYPEYPICRRPDRIFCKAILFADERLYRRRAGI